MINVERVKLAGAVAIDSIPNPRDKLSQLCMVVVRDHRARRSSLRLAGHEHEATQESSLSAASRARRQMRTLWLRESGRRIWYPTVFGRCVLHRSVIDAGE